MKKEEMCDEDWVEAAMGDDSAVVELLMRLPHATPPKREHSPALLPFEWSVRQRRSRPMLPAKNKKKKKNPTPPRASPTTPLSWSGATSASGGGCAADGFEESSSRPPPTKRPVATRSKVAAASGTGTNKRSRKKKTLAELKEDETLLLKERRNLKRELETLRATLEKRRATNGRLTRLKLDLESKQAVERVAAVASVEGINDPTMQKVLASRDPTIPSVSQPEFKTDEQDTAAQTPSLDGSSKLQQEATNQENKFMLPDLNLPIEDSHSEAVDRIIS